MNMNEAKGKLMRWLLSLLKVNFKLVYHAEAKHYAYDALFRLHTTLTTGKIVSVLEMMYLN